MRDGGGRLCRCVLVCRLRSSSAAILRALRRSFQVRESRNFAKGRICPSRGGYSDERKVEPAVAAGGGGGGGLGGRREAAVASAGLGDRRERENLKISLSMEERD